MNPTQSELAESHGVSEKKLGRRTRISHMPGIANALGHPLSDKLSVENTFLESPEGKASHRKGVS